MNHNQRQTKIDFFAIFISSFYHQTLQKNSKRFFYFFLESPLGWKYFFAAHKMHENIKKVLCPHMCLVDWPQKSIISVFFIFFGMCVACNFFCLIIFAVLMMTGHALLSCAHYKTLKAVVKWREMCHQGLELISFYDYLRRSTCAVDIMSTIVVYFFLHLDFEWINQQKIRHEI